MGLRERSDVRARLTNPSRLQVDCGAVGLTGDVRFDNMASANGLTSWLLDFVAVLVHQRHLRVQHPALRHRSTVSHADRPARTVSI